MTDDMDRIIEYMNSDEPRLGQLSPPGYAMTRFITPTLPSEPFMIEDRDDDGDSSGPYVASDWNEDPDTGAMFCNPPDGSPQYMRVISQDGNDVISIDGMGEEHEWSFVPLPDNTLPAPDMSLSPAQANRIADQTGAEH
jgi:hypothetical protein